MGMNDVESKKQAGKRVKAEKVILGVLAMSATAAVAYGGTKLARQYLDKTIKSGTILRRVSASALQNTKHNFYATDKIIDAMKYKGMYAGKQLGGIDGLNNMYQHVIKVDKDLKLASPNSARKVFKELVQNGDIVLDNPMIFFNANGKVSVNNSRKMSSKEMKAAYNKVLGLDIAKSQSGKIAVGGGLVTASTAYNKNTDSKVNSLRASGKSDKEIAKILRISVMRVKNTRK